MGGLGVDDGLWAEPRRLPATSTRINHIGSTARNRQSSPYQEHIRPLRYPSAMASLEKWEEFRKRFAAERKGLLEKNPKVVSVDLPNVFVLFEENEVVITYTKGGREGDAKREAEAVGATIVQMVSSPFPTGLDMGHDAVKLTLRKET
ncbi:hypothetical protein MKZ38_004200 [Zalerion maritima]|uniref:Uncharacterized protein n=1 Tax=Zalerion maritima TaxID=339359 RepID=A0AAD5RMB9_9PEZI|nr:hypothetical protein MKZ38_004200 [Zalerion maritima]